MIVHCTIGSLLRSWLSDQVTTGEATLSAAWLRAQFARHGLKKGYSSARTVGRHAALSAALRVDLREVRWAACSW